MRLAPIAQNIVMRSYMMSLLENISGDASAIQKQVVSLANELKADGEDITDDEVQAAMLSALISADGKIDQVDVSDIESIKTEIKESRGYLTEEGGILHGIELVGTVLGNAALIHLMAGGFKKVGINDEAQQMKAAEAVYYVLVASLAVYSGVGAVSAFKSAVTGAANGGSFSLAAFEAAMASIKSSEVAEFVGKLGLKAA